MWNWGHMNGWFLGGYGMLFWLVVVVLVIWLIVRLSNRSGNNSGRDTGTHSSQGGESALEVLKQRYARGEITREQYQEMKRDLEG